MAKDKKLALAFEFKNAPAEVKAAAEAHQANWKRLEKASDQMQKWKVERAAAQAAYDESSIAFERAIDAWDPVEKSKTKPEELA